LSKNPEPISTDLPNFIDGQTEDLLKRHLSQPFFGGKAMRARQGDKNKRREPRMHPVCETVKWRPVGSLELISSQLLDMSQNGLSLLTQQGGCPAIKAGDEIAIRYMRRDNSATHYAIVWLRQFGSALTLGCRRLTGMTATAGRRSRPYGLLLARLRRRLRKGDQEITQEDAVLLEHSRPAAA